MQCSMNENINVKSKCMWEIFKVFLKLLGIANRLLVAQPHIMCYIQRHNNLST